MNLFIDTNIYLTFYHFTKDDLEELKKLETAITNRKIRLFIPKQVVYEYKRNREVKISDAIKRISELKLPNQFPQFCKQYKEFEYLKENIADYDKNRTKLFNKILLDIKNNSLDADKIIRSLFSKGQIIEITDEIIKKAKFRYDIGNPPGKNSSYGDAINWECLLAEVKDSEDLHLVAHDKDYISKLDESQLSEFLSEEWEHSKKSSIFLYTNLSDYFSKHFPDIKLASQLEKQLLISRFIKSGSFATTHLLIKELSKYDEYSKYEINEIIEACYVNSQILSIIIDNDVNKFIISLITKNKELVEPNVLAKFEEEYYKMRKYLDDSYNCQICTAGHVMRGDICPECENIYY